MFKKCIIETVIQLSLEKASSFSLKKFTYTTYTAMQLWSTRNKANRGVSLQKVKHVYNHTLTQEKLDPVRVLG